MTKFIHIKGMPISVTDDVYYTYHKMRRYEKTLVEKDVRNRVLHYDMWDESHLNATPLSGPAPTPEDILIRKQTQIKLHKCLSKLSNAEHCLILALFYEGKTVSALAEELHIPARTLAYRRDTILLKLRRMMVCVF